MLLKYRGFCLMKDAVSVTSGSQLSNFGHTSKRDAAFCNDSVVSQGRILVVRTDEIYE